MPGSGTHWLPAATQRRIWRASARASATSRRVRLTGCPLRCVYCDTAYAFHEGQPMSPDEVLDRVRAYDCRLVEVTGGEPLLQPAVVPLMTRMLAEGYVTAADHDREIALPLLVAEHDSGGQ